MQVHNSIHRNSSLKRILTMTSTILVTGASGTIGTQLTGQLLAAGATFEVMTSKPVDTVGGVRARQASFDNVAQLTSAFQGVDTLFVLLPLVPNKVQLAQNIAAAAKAAGVKRIVRSSGAGADATSVFALPRLQGTIDDILTATGIPCTFLRNAGFMQNYATFGAQMVKDGMWYAASADAAQSLIDVRDIAAVAATILQNPAAHAGKAYTLTGGESLTDAQRSVILSTLLGKSVGFTPITVEYAATTMKNDWGMPQVMVDWMTSLNQLVSGGYAAGISPDTQTLLGRKPITFAQFAKDHLSQWQ
jgi:NAD(P)H dehydrogenase (quinone)